MTRNHRITTPFAALAAAFTVLGCLSARAHAQNAIGAQTAATQAPQSAVDGEVRKVDVVNGIVVLRHGAIRNLNMPPMTMPYEVVDRRLLEGLKVGTKVRFEAEMLKGKAMVVKLKVVG